MRHPLIDQVPPALLLVNCNRLTRLRGPKPIPPHPPCRHGEVSRAMRNRGIEIFLLPQAPERPVAAAAAAGPAGDSQQSGSLGEVQQVLALAGVPGTSLPLAMAAAHAEVAAYAAERHR